MAEMIDILVVDDDDVDAAVFQEALREVRSSVTSLWAPSGEKALNLLLAHTSHQSCPVRLIVLDLNMPGLDGIETLRAIRQSSLIATVPVILLSSSEAKKDIDRAYWFGANAFLTKPCAFEAYVEKIRALVEYWLEVAELPSGFRYGTRDVQPSKPS